MNDRVCEKSSKKYCAEGKKKKKEQQVAVVQEFVEGFICT